MTIEQIIRRYLIENGMWPDDVDAVVNAMKAQEKSLAGRCSDNTEGYERETLASIIYSAKSYALTWIDQNCPKAFYRANFE